ncbi:phage integrase [Vibrio algicola]|uniref:Tyrosine-type recombinase/integrase n=1 Tax=Vibrio algicola TaxID=2662262 RepID=A0A5Q0TD60_9VIBR|nr:tyrosine-type recombinase/integrase [Vibrio algicola]
MSIRNLKDSSKKPWLCECYPQGRGGKRIRKKFATKGEAAAFERFTMNEVDDKPWLGEKTDHRRLSDLVNRWFELHGKNLKSGAHAKRRLEMMVENMENPIAIMVTGTHFANYRANRKMKGRVRNGGEVAASTLNHDILWMKSVFNELRRLKEWKHPNPLQDFKNIKLSESELSYLTPSEIEHLFDVIKASPMADQITLICKICLSTGARISEAMNLTRSHVQPFKITYTNTKGRKNRTIPISESLFNELSARQNHQLFTCGYGVIHKWLSVALPNLPSGQTTHVLRHTFASHFMMNGGNIVVLKDILGHSDIKTTMTYAHFAPSHLSDAVTLNPLNKMAAKLATKNIKHA